MKRQNNSDKRKKNTNEKLKIKKIIKTNKK